MSRTGHSHRHREEPGLSAVLNVENRSDQLRMRTADAYEALDGFDPSWLEWRSSAEVDADWPAVDAFIDQVRSSRNIQALLGTEGPVHAVMCGHEHPGYWVFQREASPAFADTSARQSLVGPLVERIHAAIQGAGRVDAWWPGIRDNGKMPSMGTSPDLLAVDEHGRLLVIEAKPASATKGITWAPAQVRLYAELFHHLVAMQRDAVGTLQTMIDQRHQLLGGSASQPKLAEEPEVVPVVAIGAERRSKHAVPRAEEIRDALEEGFPSPHLGRTELWLLTPSGKIETTL